jgi:geranylgeranyl pyrophosphate synthase
LTSESAAALLGGARAAVDERLGRWAERASAWLPGDDGRALAYSLTAPGKRVRAALVLAAYHAAGGRAGGIAEVAAAVETVHAYSLVHDDLPCMDDDELRRGRPTTHRRFDVRSAVRAGYFLVPVAALVLASAAEELGLGAPALGRLATTLFTAGGIEGMVGGQWLDLEAEQRRLDLPELVAVHRGKTGALIAASCGLGGIAAEAPPEAVAALSSYGSDVGLAFQVADDVLDATATSDQLGKTAGKDEAFGKSTYVQLLGVDGARREAAALARRAVEHLARARLATSALASLADYIVTRQS